MLFVQAGGNRLIEATMLGLGEPAGEKGDFVLRRGKR
jgi:hypothetical protein